MLINVDRYTQLIAKLEILYIFGNKKILYISK